MHFPNILCWRALFTLTFGLCAHAVTIDMEGLPNTGLDTSHWTMGVLPPLTDMWDLNDMQIAAKNVLPPVSYAQYRTGALDEQTYHANFAVWQQIRLNGYSFRDVSNLKLNTTILGYNFSAPFFIAPAANAGLANKQDAEASLVRAAGNASILYVPSISSTLSIADIAAAAAPGQVMSHQEYIWSDTTRLRAELNDIERAGFKALFLTVDNTGINGIRMRPLRFARPESNTGHSATFDLKSLATLQNMTKLPIVPKGIKTWQDAALCATLGFPAIYISNHGGRVLDGAPTAAEVLLAIRRNAPHVFDKVEVYADGGVRRGTDVIKLLALGARAVGVGRPWYFANVFGQAGVARAIEQLRTELGTSMRLMGEADVDRIVGNASYINTKLLEQMWIY